MNYRINYTGQDSDEKSLKHWKYTSKKMVNGKWRYSYDDYYGNPYDSKKKTSKQVTTTYRNSDKMLSSTKTITTKDKQMVYKDRGKIAQQIDKGKDWINQKMRHISVTDPYDRNATSTKQVITTYGNSDKLLNSIKTVNMGDKQMVYKNRGKIARAIDKGKAYVNYYVSNRMKKK